MPLPRVLLVEDDESMRRFVATALETAGIDLVLCRNVAEAVAALDAAPARLVITDLMMPGESGQSLVARLHRDPALRQDARVVVFSAGLSAPVREHLSTLSVWRFLSKPAPVVELEACVRDAVSDVAPPAAEIASSSATPAPSDTSDPVALHFGGNAALFQAFAAASSAQFARDLETGDRASDAGDAPTLHHLAHSLKSVMSMLGCPDASGHARALEEVAAAGDVQATRSGWARLRPFLHEFQSQR